MKKAHGLRKYFYEYVFHQAVEAAREQTAEVVPISQARAIRARVDEILAQARSVSVDGTSEPVAQYLGHSKLGITGCLSAIDQALGESVRDYEPQFGDHSAADHTSELQSRFDLVCRLLLEKKKYTKYQNTSRTTGE